MVPDPFFNGLLGRKVCSIPSLSARAGRFLLLFLKVAWGRRGAGVYNRMVVSGRRDAPMKQLIVNATAAAVLTLALIAGCNHCGPRPQPQPQPGPFPPGPVLPPGGMVPGPMPKGPQEFGPELPPPQPPTQTKSSPLDPTWKPGVGPSVRLAPPEVEEESTGSKGVLLFPPIVDDQGKLPPPKVETSVQPKSVLPSGILQYALAYDKVSTGLRPSLEDGLDWLQANGCKTVLCIHEPGEQIAADRKQVEKRGMKFMALEVSALTFGKKVIDEFNRLIADTSVQPLFVYDRDGALTGSLWYLHFRLTQDLNDEKARQQAHGLGLRADRDGTYRDMWLAVQKYLSDNPR
jgi:protein tyrosine phosphatase (PTP) superfamily phosphohydrolase (DUF442 family)